MIDPRRLLAPALLVGALSCSESSASFDVKYAPGFSPDRATVSVLGVFRNGRMDAESWAQLGPAISGALGRPRCEVAYGGELAQRSPELYAAIEDGARDSGITDELLEKVAPLAEGDLILVISVHGEAKTRSLSASDVDPVGAAGPQGSMRGRAPRSRLPSPGGARRTSLDGGLGIAASLYSIRLHRSVARMSMAYEGPSLEDAVSRFAGELGKVVPGSTCRGFHRAAPP